MRAIDQTLIQRLGFMDPDKKNPMHDSAVQYLSQPNIAMKAIMNCDGSQVPRNVSCRPEMLVSKGLGQYSQHIGFLDLVYQYVVYGERYEKYREVVEEPESKPSLTSLLNSQNRTRTKTVSDGFAYREVNRVVYVEVKITEQPISEIIRQINLYRQYIQPGPFALVSRYGISVDDKIQLTNAKIRHLILGPEFDVFHNQPRKREAAVEI